MKDNYLQPGISATVGRFESDIYYDELEYRNSSVDRVWITLPGMEGDEPPYLGLARSLTVEHDTLARVEGTLPPELRGTLYRNGPGLFDRAGLRKRCIMDGDGMIQSFAFQPKGVRYRNRFVRTKKYQEEEGAGKFVYPSWSTQAPGGLLGNAFKADAIQSEASVTVYYRNDRLLAFDDTGQPWELDPETLETRGETRLGLALGASIDPRTARTFPLKHTGCTKESGTGNISRSY